MRNLVLQAQERAAQVGRDHRVELAGVDLVQRHLAAALADIVAAAQLRASRDTLPGLSDGRPPAEALRLVLHAYVSQAMEHPEMFRLIYGLFCCSRDRLIAVMPGVSV
ncbi:MAG: hypothetical protein ACREFV_08620 [Acetobacteraceae bacterium]